MTIQKMKQTEIGMIPEEWGVVTLGETTEINKESRDPSRLPETPFIYIDIESVENETGNIRNVKNLIGKEAPSRARRVVHKDDVIMSTVRPYLKAFAIVETKYENQICSTGFSVLTSKEKILPKYLLYSLFTTGVINQCTKMMTGGQYPALNSSQVTQIKIPMPPLHEQQSISEVLSTVDTRLGIVERESQRIERLKVGLMKELFDGKWKTARINEIFNVQTGTTPSTKIKQYWANGTVDWITPADMNDLNASLDLPESRRKITQKALNDVNLTLMPVGSIVMSTRAPVGYVGIVRKELTFNQGCKGLIPKDKTKTDTVFYAYFLSSLKDYLNNISGGSTFKELSKDSFCKLEVPLPPIGEQNRITEILSTVDKKLSIQSSKKSKLEKVKKQLMNDLLTGKKRVMLK